MEIKNNLEQNKVELQDEQSQNILELSKKIDKANEGLTENLSQSLLNILSENETQSARQVDQKNLLIEKFTQLEKISDAQQINFRNHFDKIENSLEAQQKMFEEIFTRQNSEIVEKFNTVKSQIKKISSELDECVTDNQKNLTKKLDSASEQQKNIYKILGSFEELLRLIAANQLILQVYTELKISSEKKNSLPDVNSGKKKKIFIYGRTRVGKTTLSDVLQRRMSNLDIIETSAINRFDVPLQPDAEALIYIIDESTPDSKEIEQFIELIERNRKILLVVNVTAKFPTKSIDERIYDKFLYHVHYHYQGETVQWSKISVVYVYLEGARRACNHDYGSFQKSGFDEIEQYISRNYRDVERKNYAH